MDMHLMKCIGMKPRVANCDNLHDSSLSAAAVASTVAIAVKVVSNRSKLNLTTVIDQLSSNRGDISASIAIDWYFRNTVASIAVAID
jgi:hypothetical protein